MALDYGLKRTGIAVTDPQQMIASGLTTIPSGNLMDFLRQYFEKESVDILVVGKPKKLDNTSTHVSETIGNLILSLKKKFPDLAIHEIDERFTSKIAMDSLIRSGVKKKERQNKALLDTVSATIILQSFLEQRQNKLF